MAETFPFGNNPAKIHRYKAFWDRRSTDRPLVGFSFIGWYPLQYFSVTRDDLRRYLDSLDPRGLFLHIMPEHREEIEPLAAILGM